MHWLDIVIIIALALAAIIGLVKGFIKMLFTLAGLVIGILLALKYYAPFSGWLSQYIHETSIAKIAAFAIILIGILIIARVLASLLSRVVSWLGQAWLNRLGGAIFGSLIGTILLGTLLDAMLRFAFFDLKTIIHESTIAAWLLAHFSLLPILFPGWIRVPL